MEGHDARILTGIWSAPGTPTVYAVAIRGIVLRYGLEAAPPLPINTRANLYGICNPGGQNP